MIGNFGETLPGFQFVRLLGKGSFGEVFLATKINTQVQYAIKRYRNRELKDNPLLAAKILDEIKTMQKVDNDHVLKIYEKHDTPQHMFLVLEFCDGGDLSGVMKNLQQVIPESTIKIYFQDLLKGFQALHAHQIIHRDIKTENLLLKAGKIVIGDFGVCKYGVAQTGTVVGNPCTIAPEIRKAQIGNLAKYDFKVDVWSLGVTLYMLLVGRDPWNFYSAFTDRRIPDVITLDWSLNCGQNLPFPSNIPLSDDMKRLLRWMITEEPTKRPTWFELESDRYFNQNNPEPYYGPGGIATTIYRQDPPSPQRISVDSPAPQASPFPHNARGMGSVMSGWGGNVATSGLLVNNNPFATQNVPSMIYIPPEFSKDTAFEYFAHNQRTVMFLSETAQMLETPAQVNDSTVKSLMLGCAACIQTIAFGIVSQTKQLLLSKVQPQGIQTSFGGTAFYDTQLSEGVLQQLEGLAAKELDKTFEFATKIELHYPARLPEKQRIINTIQDCFDGVNEQIFEIAKKVAQALAVEIGKHQHNQQAYKQMKKLLVRIYLCLTHQTSMEFRDKEKNPFNWQTFDEDVKTDFMVEWTWPQIRPFLGVNI